MSAPLELTLWVKEHLMFILLAKAAGQDSLTQMAIGYEVTQFPLQTLALYNAVANNGVMLKPVFEEKPEE